MKRTLSVLALTALAATVPAHAAILAVSFTGTVFQAQGATGQAIGSTVMGHFDLNSTTGSYLDFTIGGKSVATGYMSSANIGPALTDAIYMAQLSPVSTGMPSNSTFSLDLSSLTTWPSTDTPYTLLTDPTQLTTNLDTINKPSSAFPSTFGYYTANSNGTNVVSLTANLTSVNVSASAIPEPASLALVAFSLLGLVLFARRLGLSILS
jgi:hypothetical protein